jgi:excisionase family DNA binding protein
MDDASQDKKSRRRHLHGQSNTRAAVSPARTCLTYEEVSAQTGLSLSTLRRRVMEGKLPFIQPGGRRTRIVFPIDVVERLLQDSGSPSEKSPVLTSSTAVSAANPVHRGPKPKWLQGTSVSATSE